MKACPSCHSSLIVQVRHRDSRLAWACLACFSCWAGRHLPLRFDRIAAVRDTGCTSGPLGEVQRARLRQARAEGLGSQWPWIESEARKAGRAYIPWKGKRATWP